MARRDRVARSLRSPRLRALHAAWSAARPEGGLPRLEDLDLDALEARDDLAVAMPEPGRAPLCFRLVRVGSHLVARAGRPLLNELICGGEDPPGDPIGGAAWAYRRCFETAAPSYEFAHFRFGEDGPLLFERLLLPLGEHGRPARLLAASLFSEPGAEPEPG
ncbi:PAS domain-containing protein [Paracraurococcus lichenis]|uniref:PAS domain-containing protein n=1 Tax=Paracraurococcus lichenis TaxID=3064888 RepID=A0ABT9E5F0_9PROT|nr:hypothetical protein [Paracraurococcus sp. LOR1-02]MDO9711394.1 hypothetical protein [Paracraurococcus sp. LOR1-02]